MDVVGIRKTMITLVLGGARSGKSRFAEGLAAASGGPVIYVATAVVADDPDFEERVRIHRRRRPAEWETGEPGADLAAFVRQAAPERVLLIDSLGTWVAAHHDFEVDAADLCDALSTRRTPAIVVSEEVGLGVHPSTELGGRFRDRLGAVNQAVAGCAGDAWLIVAGRGLRLEKGA
ncbi:MAG TPA: bifunctional adenosylcobinamide kinase/adenosylcobinamide-phosphate guanylyltransferase [Acidimicrobiales bacterium]|nr:bifunctional adenosylcobinamide kinase/adenosylcobinamide-phosphate guanylyltransferase [Acidimicrobiales bacterium]